MMTWNQQMKKSNSLPEPVKKKERVQKVLANLGVGSRRSIEELIRQSKITINQKTAELGQLIYGDEVIHINGRRIHIKKKDVFQTRLIIYHKPEGEIVSHSDPKHQLNVFQNLPKIKNGKWISIGRLDINTSGLLLITNDGNLANHMMHPSKQIDREYSVRILGEVTEMIIKNIKAGINLEDGIAHVDEFEHAGGEGANQWYKMILREGKNREIRRIIESQNLQVSRLIRTRYGPIQLPTYLKRGKFKELEKKDIDKIMKSLEIS